MLSASCLIVVVCAVAERAPLLSNIVSTVNGAAEAPAFLCSKWVRAAILQGAIASDSAMIDLPRGPCRDRERGSGFGDRPQAGRAKHSEGLPRLCTRRCPACATRRSGREGEGVLDLQGSSMR
jgi:hypothetical protein